MRIAAALVFTLLAGCGGDLLPATRAEIGRYAVTSGAEAGVLQFYDHGSWLLVVRGWTQDVRTVTWRLRSDQPLPAEGGTIVMTGEAHMGQGTQTMRAMLEFGADDADLTLAGSLHVGSTATLVALRLSAELGDESNEEMGRP